MCIINMAVTRHQAPEEILCSQLCLFNMSLLRKGDYRALILQNDGRRLGKEKGDGGVDSSAYTCSVALSCSSKTSLLIVDSKGCHDESPASSLSAHMTLRC